MRWARTPTAEKGGEGAGDGQGEGEKAEVGEEGGADGLLDDDSSGLSPMELRAEAAESALRAAQRRVHSCEVQAETLHAVAERAAVAAKALTMEAEAAEKHMAGPHLLCSYSHSNSLVASFKAPLCSAPINIHTPKRHASTPSMLFS